MGASLLEDNRLVVTETLYIDKSSLIASETEMGNSVCNNKNCPLQIYIFLPYAVAK